MDVQTAQALIRFGLGRRTGEPVPTNARGWLADQIKAPDPAHFPGLPTTATALQARFADFRNKPSPGQGEGAKLFVADANAQLAEALTTAAPYRERLVQFWANHFTISRLNGGVAPLAGPYVREAIRPFVTGRFRDMLVAVMRHPAMLLYLDNAVSVGPHSPVGRRGHLGLNENLARESLELHTVSPAAGYTQADVTTYAAILTGWSVSGPDDPPGFKFRPKLHEPGRKTLMSRTFAEGEQGGMEVLAFLASHPSTHRHLATKLVRHFVADEPPPAAIAAIEGVLRDTDGDLGATALALVALPDAWKPLTKLRSPNDYVLALLRAGDLADPAKSNVLTILARLGQPPFSATFPIGWPDTAAEWAAPEEIMRRLDWAYTFSARMAQHAVPADVAEASLGALLQTSTLRAIQNAGSRQDALALLFASPEFQRR